jgi:threonylcarbamoyladenosine tRNA methylthiotransferase MtaB
MGCAAVVNKQAYSSLQQVFAVVSSVKELLQILELPHSSSNVLPPPPSKAQSLNDELPVINSPPNVLIPHFHERTRAFLAIQNGCDNHCSFCITRLARGKSVSFPVSQILEQAKVFANTAGINEITITGINISSFNYDNCTLGRLILLLLAELPERVRLRISSLDPANIYQVTERIDGRSLEAQAQSCVRRTAQTEHRNDEPANFRWFGIDDNIFVALENPRVLPHLHFSVQSGDDTILRRMGRRHTRAMVEELVRAVRHIRRDISLGCDIICGFPTETDEMFSQTVDLVRECQIPLLHVFPYSDRPGTSASLMTPKVPKNVKNERAAVLRSLGREILLDRLKGFVGQEVNFLAEKWKDGFLLGTTDHFFKICVTVAKVSPQTFSGSEIGQVLQAKVLGVNRDCLTLVGQLI